MLNCWSFFVWAAPEWSGEAFPDLQGELQEGHEAVRPPHLRPTEAAGWSLCICGEGTHKHIQTEGRAQQLYCNTVLSLYLAAAEFQESSRWWLKFHIPAISRRLFPVPGMSSCFLYMYNEKQSPEAWRQLQIFLTSSVTWAALAQRGDKTVSLWCTHQMDNWAFKAGREIRCWSCMRQLWHWMKDEHCV